MKASSKIEIPTETSDGTKVEAVSVFVPGIPFEVDVVDGSQITPVSVSEPRV